MCVIIYKPPEKVVSRNQLLNCWKLNYEGAGFMWSDSNSLFINKGFFRFRKFYRSFRMIERANPNSGFVIHFRKVSSGSLGVENCHPFYFNNKTLGFAHNGTLSDWIKAGEDRCDSLNFTTGILEKLPANFDKILGIRFLLNKYAEHHGSKFIFMNFSGDVFLTNQKEWKELGGVYFSNNSYLGIKTPVITSISGNFQGNNYNYDYFSPSYIGRADWEACSVCNSYFRVAYLTLVNGQNACFSCKKGLLEKYKAKFDHTPKLMI